MVTFLDSASEKTLRSTVALTASRGRGKSAALGEVLVNIPWGVNDLVAGTHKPLRIEDIETPPPQGVDLMVRRRVQNKCVCPLPCTGVGGGHPSPRHRTSKAVLVLRFSWSFEESITTG